MQILNRILFLLLLPISFFGQKVEYYPKRDATYNQIRDVGYAVLSPENIQAGQKLKLAIFVHGHGERSGGTIESLKNLVLGPDNNNDGVREPGFVTDDMKRAVNLFGLLLIVPTYESDQATLSVAKINTLYDWAQANYSVYPKMMPTGFSGGGGSVLAYIKSTLENANRCAYVVLCASINAGGDKTIPGRANLPVHVATNSDDRTVHKSNSQQIVADINATATLKALYTEFNRSGHGSNEMMWSLTPPKAQNGQGFTDAAENIYQVFTDILETGNPRQMKSGTVIPSSEPVPTPPTTKAIAKFTLIGPNLKLDGSSSTGWTNGTDGVWEYVSGPVRYSWDVFTQGSSYIVANTTLKVAGKYQFAFKLKGDPEVQLVTVDFGKIVVFFDSVTGLITYSDGTTEKGTAIYSAGKWALKNSAGQIINL